MKIVLSQEAAKQLKKLYLNIRNNSVKNAENVRSAIIDSLDSLTENPGQYPPDKYKSNNDGSFRAYEIYRYRITYHISEEQIIVLRIRHTKMNPSDY